MSPVRRVRNDVFGTTPNGRDSQRSPTGESDGMDWRTYIHRDPEVAHGRAVFRGTRVPVPVVLDSLSQGVSTDDLLASYPSLRPTHLTAALAYAAHLARTCDGGENPKSDRGTA
jgi:uncharacterized protein (DUF433 family)